MFASPGAGASGGGRGAEAGRAPRAGSLLTLIFVSGGAADGSVPNLTYPFVAIGRQGEADDLSVYGFIRKTN